MKKFLVLALTAVMLVSTSIAPKKAHADGGAIAGTVIGVVAAVGLGIWTIYELVVVGDELTASTSEFSGQVYNKREMLERVEDDAFAFLAGDAPSAILQRTLEASRDNLGTEGQNLSDRALARAAIQYAEAELANF